MKNLNINFNDLYPETTETNEKIVFEKGELPFYDNDIRIFRKYNDINKEYGCVTLCNILVCDYTIENGRVLLKFPNDLNTLIDIDYFYNITEGEDVLKNDIINIFSSFLAIDESNIEYIIDGTVLDLYKVFIEFNDILENIYLCNTYIGIYDLDLNIRLIKDFIYDNKTLELIKNIITDEFYNSDKFNKFTDGYSKDVLTGKIHWASSERVLIILDEPFNNRNQLLIKNKDLIKLTYNITSSRNNYIKIISPIFKHYYDRLILGSCNAMCGNLNSNV